MIEHTQALLDEILRADDPVARNRMITLCYRDLATGLAGIVGAQDLNWFVFGVWASGTAGAAIRGEGLPLDLGTSENVAAGNLAIIRDVAPPFVRWLREVERAGAPTREACERALADPLFARVPKLAAAIRCYQAAAELRAGAPDGGDADKQAAELVLLGNLLLGEHEQAVVDRFIDAAMPLGCLFGLVTTRFVRIDTPDGPLDVCRDVAPPVYLAGALFPDVLSDLANPELCAACERYGQSIGPDAAASNALAWEDYDDRMGYILTFFRAYQRDARFFEVPRRYLPADAESAHGL
ncbi:hypothetical protein P0L94_09775 [Microbacter sp. GSS18]|nr:hypothetical protein P0L94_09775 [Microbacter sp. GSS18]